MYFLSISLSARTPPKNEGAGAGRGRDGDPGGTGDARLAEEIVLRLCSSRARQCWYHKEANEEKKRRDRVFFLWRKGNTEDVAGITLCHLLKRDT